MRPISLPVNRKPLSIQSRKTQLRILHELFLSLSIAMAITGVLMYGCGVFVPFVDLSYRLNRQMGLAQMSPCGWCLAWGIYVATIGGLFWGTLRLSRHFSVTEWVLKVGACFIAIIVPPAAWFEIVRCYGWYPAEVITYLVLATWFIARKSAFPCAIIIPITAMHFWFWCELFWEYTRNPVEVLLPITCFLSALTWYQYRKI